MTYYFAWLASEIFSVGVPQFEITGLPGTLDKLLCILGSNNILPKLVAFWYSYVKSSFPVILPWDFRPLNILLLLSTRSGKILSLKITSWCIFLSPSYFSAKTTQPFLSQTTTQEPLSAVLIIILQYLPNILLVSIHPSFFIFSANKYSSAGYDEQKNKKTTGQIQFLVVTIKQRIKHKNNSCVYINIKLLKQNKLNKDSQELNMRASNWNLRIFLSFYVSYSFKRIKRKGYKETKFPWKYERVM